MSLEVASKQETEPIPQEVFQAYMDANLTYPLNYLGMSIYVGAELFHDPNGKFDPQRFARTEYSEDQLNTTKTMMDRAHAKRGVPVRSVDAPPHSGVEHKILSDERMRDIWRNQRMTTLVMAAMLSGMNKIQIRALIAGLSSDPDEEGKVFPLIQRTTARAMLFQLRRKLADPEIYKGVGEAFAMFKKTLTGPTGRERSKNLRDLLEQRVAAKNVEEEKERVAKYQEVLTDLMTDVLLKDYRAQGGTYVTLKIEKNWLSDL